LPEFVLAVLLLELTPGPNMAYLATLTIDRGRAAGLLATGGVAWLSLPLPDFRLPASLDGGLNRSTQHFILKRKDGV
jgi:hypothetical protein